MSLTQRRKRWLAGNHSGCWGGDDGAGESEEVGVKVPTRGRPASRGEKAAGVG
ncbi:hypothetical protein E2C01_036688 [Portunus trituberculatus]|uniref:Uncharacterized protein n=1 Tax=Portunus trituberculatus TaxID=210409 RepID=A0A5B7F9C5_PORTR|nr:hypothetical protein [Portunus trituberculatus]